MHLAISGIYGILFGVIWALALHVQSLTPFLRHATLVGILYGIILFFLAWYFLLPASNSQLLNVPFFDLGLAHIIYGADPRIPDTAHQPARLIWFASGFSRVRHPEGCRTLKFVIISGTNLSVATISSLTRRVVQYVAAVPGSVAASSFRQGE